LVAADLAEASLVPLAAAEAPVWAVADSAAAEDAAVEVVAVVEEVGDNTLLRKKIEIDPDETLKSTDDNCARSESEDKGSLTIDF
jgi:hypothetical protein